MKRAYSQDPIAEVVQKLRQFVETMDPASYEPMGPKIRSSIDHRFDQGNLIMLVHGDTTTSFAAALVRIPRLQDSTSVLPLFPGIFRRT